MYPRNTAVGGGAWPSPLALGGNLACNRVRYRRVTKNPLGVVTDAVGDMESVPAPQPRAAVSFVPIALCDKGNMHNCHCVETTCCAAPVSLLWFSHRDDKCICADTAVAIFHPSMFALAALLAACARAPVQVPDAAHLQSGVAPVDVVGIPAPVRNTAVLPRPRPALPRLLAGGVPPQRR